MKNIVIGRFIVVLLSVLAAAGCATTKDKDYALLDALNAYESTIRWGYFDRIPLFHTAESLQSARAPANPQDIKVTSYRQLTQRPGADGNSLDQLVEIKYYYWSQAKEKTTRQEQHWVYNTETARWQITTPPPRFD